VKKKIRVILVRILAALCLAALAVFIGLEVFIHSYNPVQTQTALTMEQEQFLTVQGKIFRDEEYVTYNGSGVLDYELADGERVASGGTVALCYQTEAEAEAGKRKKEIQAKIDNIRLTSSVNDYYVLDLDRIKDDITEALYDIVGVRGEEGTEALASAVDELCDNVTRKQAATGVSLDFSKKLASLQEQLNALDEEISSSPKNVKTSRSGYFFSACDGFENSVDTAKIAELTVSDFLALKKGEVPENAVGKLAVGFEWYYVFATDRATAQTFSEGGTVSLRFPVSGAEPFTASVRKVNYTGEEALVILKCTNMSQAYAVMREQAVQIVTKKYVGLYVPDGAIRVIDGVQGVYVLIGVEVKFRRIDVLWSCEEYAVVKACETGSGGLQLYDDIITKGNNLYDGKLIYRQAT